MNIHETNREIRFDTRKSNSPYRCNYRDRSMFELLRINCKFNGVIKEVYEIESKHLPDRDSISFKAVLDGDSFKITNWSPQSIIPFLKRIK